MKLAEWPIAAECAAVAEYPAVLSTPKVSVIMAAYNAEATIAESINSILVQTFTDWELLIVDDCSTDSTLSIIAGMAKEDARIRIYHAPENQGVAATRNFAIAYAIGGWIAFLDSDDIWHKEKLDKQLRFAEETAAVITYTGTAYMDETGNISSYILPAKPKLPYKTLLHSNLMSCSSVMVRKDAMKPFPVGASTHEDYAVWLQIVSEVGHASGLNEPLLTYRMGNESKSAARLHSAIMTYNAYRQVRFGRFMSFLLTVRYALHSVSKRLNIRLGRMNAGARTNKAAKHHHPNI